MSDVWRCGCGSLGTAARRARGHTDKGDILGSNVVSTAQQCVQAACTRDAEVQHARVRWRDVHETVRPLNPNCILDRSQKAGAEPNKMPAKVLSAEIDAITNKTVDYYYYYYDYYCYYYCCCDYNYCNICVCVL